MSPPASSTIVRTALRVVPGRRSTGARILTVAALATALASAGRRLWLARAARRFAAVRGPRFERTAVALLPAAGATTPVRGGSEARRPATPAPPAPAPDGSAPPAPAADRSTGGAS